MFLKLLGSARSEPSKLTKLQLLILSYVCLEGEQNRDDLANLFFAHLDKPRESLRVTIAKLNQKLGKNSIGIDNDCVSINLDCKTDVHDFKKAVEQKEFEKALQLYQDYFFKGMEQDRRLELTDQLQAWLFDLREEFAEQIRTALISLAKEAKTKSRQKKYAERAFLIEKAPEFFFEEIEELCELLTRNKSRFAHAAKAELNKLHAEGIFGHLKQKDKNILLAMAVVEKYRLSYSCLERALAQNSQMLFDFRHKLTEMLKPLAADEAMQAILATTQEYLDDYPNERNHFALELAKESCDRQKLFNLYEDIFRTRNDFGNAQELPEHIEKIKTVYREKAEELLENQDFPLAESLLKRVRLAEEGLGLETKRENLFLEAYALERRGQFAKALELIESGQQTERIEALRSVLLLHAKNLDEAELKAKAVLAKTDDTWAQALAYNSLGTVKVHKGFYYEAIEYFSKAGNRWKLLGQDQRYLGAIMNQANSYSYAGEIAEATKLYEQLLEKPEINQDLRIAVLVNKADMFYKNNEFEKSETISAELLELIEKSDSSNEQLYCRVLANLAYAKLQLNKPKEATELFDKVIAVAYKIADKYSQANALFGKGQITKNLSQLEDALEIYSKLEHNYLEIGKPIYINIIKDLLKKAVAQKNHDKASYLLKRLIAFLQRYEPKQTQIAKLSELKSQLVSTSKAKPEFYRRFNSEIDNISLYLIK